MRRGGPSGRVVAVAITIAGMLAGFRLLPIKVPVADAAGPFDVRLASPLLARAPYLTDLTQTSVQISWATATEGHGTARWGTPGSCSQNLVSTGTFNQLNVAPTGYTLYDFQSTMTISGLAPASVYCYRVYAADGTDLLGAGNPSPTFTTLDPVTTSSLAPLTFAVVGDFGDNTDSTTGAVSPTAANASQQAIDAAIAASGARFVVGVGDIAYQDGSQSNYGDLRETGVNAPGGTEAQRSQISNIFGPSYWANIQGVPFFAANGNHGQNSNILMNWPEPATVAASGGTYAMTAYPAVDGASAATYPATWYAISSGNVRIYVLDASWSDDNVGSSTGGLCPTPPIGTNPCAAYQVDHDQHWTTSSREYQWLKADLEAHRGGVKFAMFHFPLRVDNATQPGNPYLQASPSNPNSLEGLLSANGVSIVFNGHAHLYQRNVPGGPGQVISYVTGGGGGKVQPVGTGSTPCSASDAYAVGWSFAAGQGSACGSAPVPSSPAAVYHFLKITVAGSRVTVAPQNALGQTFDVQTYDLGPGTVMSEDVESGGLASWSPVVGGVTAQSAVTHGGQYAAQITSSGGQGYALRGLSAPAGQIWAQAWVRLAASPTTSATLFGLKSPTRQVIAVYLRAGGVTTVRNNVSGVNYQSQTVLTADSWHRIVLHASIIDGAFDVTVDGVPDPALTKTGQDLGSSAFTRFQLGDDATGRTLNFYADDMHVSTARIPDPPIFADGFETGGLAGWQPIVGLGVASSSVHSGIYAAMLTASGAKSYALHSLPAAYDVLAAEAWVANISQSTSVTLFGLRNSSAQVIQVYLASNGQVKVRNNVSGVNYAGSLTVASGSGWHRVVLSVNRAGGTFAVAIDGATDPSLSKSGQNLGTTALTSFQLGDDSTGRTFNLSIDDVAVSAGP